MWGAHRQLADLMRHEHASLALAQTMQWGGGSGAIVTSLLNYRHSAGAGDAQEKARAWEGIRVSTGKSAPTIP